jgi:hypothetical protein
MWFELRFKYQDPWDGGTYGMDQAAFTLLFRKPPSAGESIAFGKILQSLSSRVPRLIAKGPGAFLSTEHF